MKKTSLLISLCILVLTAFGQTPSWVWAKKGTGNLLNIPGSSATDAFGNVYVTGNFTSTTLIFGNDTLHHAGSFDIFLVKYDASGNVIWAKSAGGNNVDYSNSVVTDASGAVYIAGYFQGDSIRFGNAVLLNAGPGYKDMFVVKYDSAGNVRWAKRAGGTDEDEAVSVTSTNGSVYIAGNFRSSSFVFNNTTITNTSWGDDQIFLARYDTSGTEQWGINEGGLFDNFVNALTSDPAGNVYVTGTFGTSITFGSTTLTNANGSHFFLARYDSLANFSWAHSFGGDGSDMPCCISADALGNIFMSGWFDGTVSTFGATTLTNAAIGHSDLFIAKFDSSGAALWAKSAGGINNDEALSVCTDNLGNAVITGDFVSPSITFGPFTFTNSGAYDLFVTKYDALGNVIWAKKVGTSSSEFGRSVAIDGLGNVYVAGDFNSPFIVFGPVTLNNVNQGSDELFLAKLDITTGMNESPGTTLISVYPNPGSGKFIIEAKGDLTIYNLAGEKIYAAKLIADQTEIDLSGKAKGIYFIRVSSDSETSTQKIIIN